MNIHEHQTKNPIEYGGVAVPYSAAVFTPEEAIAAAETLGGPIWVVKSQIHAGGRGAGRFQMFYKQSGSKKPMARFIVGVTAPPGKRVGHASAIISGGNSTVRSKIEAMKNAGVTVAESPALIGEAIVAAMNG